MTLVKSLRLAAVLALLTAGSFVNFATASVESTSTDLGNNWKESPWLGDYYADGSGWLYQPKWGWLYEQDSGGDGMWFYCASESAWYWSGGNCYPSVYSYGLPGWEWFWKDTTNPRLYYGCDAKTWTASDGSDGTLWHMYYNAIVDAETAEYSEICTTLTAINTHNDALPWNGDHSAVTMVSWMPSTYISSYTVGQDVTPTWYIWVSVGGLAQTFAKNTGLTGDALTLRMKELLGLRPDKAYAYWVEFEVPVADLFRPTPDPDPSDCEAELDFPTGSEESVSDDYKTWFLANEASSYVLSRTGAPWTRLGYTYDWAGTRGVVGLSEFIIRPGSTVLVKAIHTNAEYLETQ